MSKLFCRISALVLILLTLSYSFGVSAANEAQTPDSYLYDSEGNVVAAPESYVYKQVITAESIGSSGFGELVDLAKDKQGNIYLLDKKNAEITVIDKAYKLIRVIGGFENAGKTESFSEPSGISVSANGNIYVADTGNGRVVELDKSGALIKCVGAPDKEESQYENEYRPSKVEADNAGRIYVIAENQTQGIFSFNAEGKFMGYVGATEVKPDFGELFFRMFASKEQKKATIQFIPTEYSNISMDEENFLFCVISAVDIADLVNDIQSKQGSVNPVRRLNQDGTNITVQNGSFPLVGELTFDPYVYGANAGASNFVDVAAYTGGIYSVLDSKRGRVFTYDGQGNLLYIFGGRGDSRGQFNQPCALVYNGADILVADRSRNTIQVFSPTRYSSLICDAVRAYNIGEYEKEFGYWQEVLSVYGGSELAYSGLGRYHYNNDEYKTAMECFKTANNRDYYSKAVKKYIALIGRAVTPYAVLGVAGLAVIIKLIGVYRKKHQGAKGKERYQRLRKFLEHLKYSGYIALHPFDGFWDLKHEKRGSAGAATLLLIAATLANTVYIRFKAFTFNTFDPEAENALVKGALGVAVLVLLWCVANWSMTTLMDGKGTMKDIYCYMCYSLLPVIVIFPIATLVSYLLPLEGGSLLTMLTTLAVVWTAFLIFAGTSSTHSYTAGKTVGTIVLTLLGMMIILFLFVLTITLIQQIVVFISLLAKEISMRA